MNAFYHKATHAEYTLEQRDAVFPVGRCVTKHTHSTYIPTLTLVCSFAVILFAVLFCFLGLFAFIWTINGCAFKESNVSRTVISTKTADCYCWLYIKMNVCVYVKRRHLHRVTSVWTKTLHLNTQRGLQPVASWQIYSAVAWKDIHCLAKR